MSEPNPVPSTPATLRGRTLFGVNWANVRLIFLRELRDAARRAGRTAAG